MNLREERVGAFFFADPGIAFPVALDRLLAAGAVAFFQQDFSLTEKDHRSSLGLTVFTNEAQSRGSLPEVIETIQADRALGLSQDRKYQ